MARYAENHGQVASWKWLKETLLSGKTVSNYVTDSSPSDGQSVTYQDLKNNFTQSGKVDDYDNKTDTYIKKLESCKRCKIR